MRPHGQVSNRDWPEVDACSGGIVAHPKSINEIMYWSSGVENCDWKGTSTLSGLVKQPSGVFHQSQPPHLCSNWGNRGRAMKVSFPQLATTDDQRDPCLHQLWVTSIFMGLAHLGGEYQDCTGELVQYRMTIDRGLMSSSLELCWNLVSAQCCEPANYRATSGSNNIVVFVPCFGTCVYWL